MLYESKLVASFDLPRANVEANRYRAMVVLDHVDPETLMEQIADLSAEFSGLKTEIMVCPKR